MMEDDDGIGLILARATELRLKISDCLQQTSSVSGAYTGEGRVNENCRNGERSSDSVNSGEAAEDEEEEDSEHLFHIRDALESLESQLAALQNLRQRQQYEKQVALTEIDCSRKVLLEKLEEYKGKSLEVIHETTAFASERVEFDHHLLLPPYSVHPLPSTLVSENDYPKDKKNPIILNAKSDAKTNRSSNWVIGLVGSVAKAVLPIIAVISVVSASGYGPAIKKRCRELKVFDFLQSRVDLGKRWLSGKRRSSEQCPPGRVLVVENGEARCLVKERVEIPFDSIAAKPDVTYGYG